MKFRTLALGTLSMVVATVAQAQVGSVGFSDIGSPSVSPGTDINSANTFTIGNLVSNANGQGIFAGLGNVFFGETTFDVTRNDSLSFSAPSFGSFISNAIYLNSVGSGSITFDILGNYTSGTFDGGAILNETASFTINFNQTGGPSAAISDSATFSIPPVEPTPEPTSLALLGVGAGAMLLRLRRRSA